MSLVENLCSNLIFNGTFEYGFLFSPRHKIMYIIKLQTHKYRINMLFRLGGTCRNDVYGCTMKPSILSGLNGNWRQIILFLWALIYLVTDFW